MADFFKGMKDFFMGTPGKERRLDLYRPGQQTGMEQMLQQGLSGLQGGAPSFEPIRERAMKTYQEDIVPSLAERFGGMGAQGSSGFREAISKGGTDLSSTLAAMESQFGQQQHQNLMQMLGVGLGQQEDVGWVPKDPGFFGAMAPAFGEGMGRSAAGWFGGGGDSAKIAKLISLLSKLVGG